jgi:pimeloyl-ACP methyl ester carboxylesterase
LNLRDAFDRFGREAKRGGCDTGRYRAHYFDWGRGPEALVFVHGLADLARSFVPLAAELSYRYRCVAYDQPHGGADGARVGRYRHDDFVADLVGLLDHLGIDRAVPVGSSFGTTIVLRALHDHPDRFPRAVLQGGFARRPLLGPELTLARVARYAPASFRMADLPLRERTQREFDLPAFVGAPPGVWEFFAANSGAMPARTVARRALLLHRLDLRSLLPAVRQSVLLVGGDRDRVVPLAYEKELLGALPSGSRVEFSPCGHYPQYTHAGEMAEAIRAFVR